MTNSTDDGALDGSAFWLIRSDPLVMDRLLSQGARSDRLAVLDEQRWNTETEALAGRLALAGLEARPLRDVVPPLRLGWPGSVGDAPDYFMLGRHRFASPRLQEVLSPWADLLDWVPLDIVGPDPDGHRAGYRLMRLLAHRPAFDLAASGLANKPPGELIVFTSRYVLRDDLTDAPAMLLADDYLGPWLAADAVAARVMRAGCTGIDFRHPEDSAPSGRYRIRGPDGVILQGA